MSERRYFILGAFVLAATLIGWMSQPEAGSAFIARRSDNVCGLQNVEDLSHPARVDYPRLIASTPEWKRIKKERIDPDSAQGLILLTEARSRVLAASDRVRRSKGHCSVWRKIRRRDGKPIADVTEEVLSLIRSSGYFALRKT